jgi:hypothetical protein
MESSLLKDALVVELVPAAGHLVEAVIWSRSRGRFHEQYLQHKYQNK